MRSGTSNAVKGRQSARTPSKKTHRHWSYFVADIPVCEHWLMKYITSKYYILEIFYVYIVRVTVISAATTGGYNAKKNYIRPIWRADIMLWKIISTL
jgi:hypothetical protein